jgi:plastocyanin
MMRDMRTSHRVSRRLLVLAATGLLVLGLSACGGDDDDSASTSNTTAASSQTTGAASETTTADDGGGTAGAGADVTIDGFAFSSGAVVKAGDEIVVENKDDVTHTFTSDDDAWESVEIPGGETKTVTAPSEAGDYKFHCEIHKSMTGSLTIEA